MVQLLPYVVRAPNHLYVDMTDKVNQHWPHQLISSVMSMQNKLEELLVHVNTIPKDVAEAAERAREKDRRTVAREEKLQLQKQDHVRPSVYACTCIV